MNTMNLTKIFWENYIYIFFQIYDLGAAEGVGMIEQVMERIARITGKDPLEVRMINMNDTDKQMLTPLIDELKKSSDYENRLIDIKKFNNVRKYSQSVWIYYMVV